MLCGRLFAFLDFLLKYIQANLSCYCNYRNLTRSCADQLIQDAVMYRFLVFHDQNSLTWKDQITFTESMGDGRAHMETKTINRKVYLL